MTRTRAVIAVMALVLAGCVQGAGGSLFGPPGAQGAARCPDRRPEAREHRELVAAFGGEYRSQRITAVLDRILTDLAPATQEPDLRFSGDHPRFTRSQRLCPAQRAALPSRAACWLWPMMPPKSPA